MPHRHGVHLAGTDRSVNSGDDFFRFARAACMDDAPTERRGLTPLRDTLNRIEAVRETLSENIAMTRGSRLRTMRIDSRCTAKDLPAQDGFTGDQQFFISYAQSWRQKYRDEMLRRIVLTDGHSPSMYRAQTVRNLDAWSPAFSVQPGTALYLAPYARVRVW
jgi:predicted metalloendopeptidase